MYFICFEREVVPGCESFPEKIDVPASERQQGGRGVACSLSLNGKRLILKWPRDQWSRFDEAKRSEPMPREWRAFHQEYVKLVEMNGLGGHVPHAYAFGAAVVETASGEQAKPAFIMEDMKTEDTDSLRNIMEERTEGFSAIETAGFGKRLLNIIDLQNRYGIAHADLSKNNVLVTVDGDHITDVYVIDYGSAKYEDSGATPPPQPNGYPQSAPRLATLDFGAPEIFPLDFDAYPDDGDMPGGELKLNYSWRNNWTVDLWSLGALLLYVRTNNLPPSPIIFDRTEGIYRNQTGKRFADYYEAYETLVRKKRDGLSLPLDEFSSDEDKKLHKIIEYCTLSSPIERGGKHGRIIELLESICSPAQQDKRASFAEKEGIGPEDTPSLCLTGVRAVQCRMSRNQKHYSPYQTDIVIFLPSMSSLPDTVTVGKVEYDLQPVADDVVPENGLSELAGPPGCPWKNVEFAIFFDHVSPKDLSNWFNGCRRLRRVLRIDNLDTSEATSMRGMFQGCSSLAALSVSRFDTSNMRDMSHAFHGCKELAELDISNFETDSLKDARGMFSGCKKLETLKGMGTLFLNKYVDLSGLGNDCPAVARYLDHPD